MTNRNRLFALFSVGTLMAFTTSAALAQASFGAPQGFDRAGVTGGYAAPQGFAAPSVSTIAQVLRMPDDSYATIQGKFTRHLGRDHYEFQDKNGQTIVTELDDDRNWSFIRPGELFEITGEVDRDQFSIKFDVHSARPLSK